MEINTIGGNNNDLLELKNDERKIDSRESQELDKNEQTFSLLCAYNYCGQIIVFECIHSRKI